MSVTQRHLAMRRGRIHCRRAPFMEALRILLGSGTRASRLSRGGRRRTEQSRGLYLGVSTALDWWRLLRGMG